MLYVDIILSFTDNNPVALHSFVSVQQLTFFTFYTGSSAGLPCCEGCPEANQQLSFWSQDLSECMYQQELSPFS